VNTWPLLLGAWFFFEMVTRFRLSRRLLAELFRMFVLLELAAERLVRLVKRPRFVLTGQCHHRGVCCQQIVGDPPRFVKRQRWLLELFCRYHLVAHRFRVVGRGPEDELIFSCEHLTAEGQCGIYRFRPYLCRNYPLVPFYEAPKVLPGCGFVPIPRVVLRMKPRLGLNVLNPYLSVHHPSPGVAGESLFEHYQLIDDSCPKAR